MSKCDKGKDCQAGVETKLRKAALKLLDKLKSEADYGMIPEFRIEKEVKALQKELGLEEVEAK